MVSGNTLTLSENLARLFPFTSTMLTEPTVFKLYTLIPLESSTLKIESWHVSPLPWFEHAVFLVLVIVIFVHNVRERERVWKGDYVLVL